MKYRSRGAVLVAALVVLSVVVGPVGASTVSETSVSATSPPQGTEVQVLNVTLQTEDTVVDTLDSSGSGADNTAPGDSLTDFATGDDVYTTGTSTDYSSGDDLWIETDASNAQVYNENGQLVGGGSASTNLNAYDAQLDVAFDGGSFSTVTLENIDGSSDNGIASATQSELGIEATTNSPSAGQVIEIDGSNYTIESITGSTQTDTATVIGDTSKTASKLTGIAGTVSVQDSNALGARISDSFGTQDIPSGGTLTKNVSDGSRGRLKLGVSSTSGTFSKGEVLSINTDLAISNESVSTPTSLGIVGDPKTSFANTEQIKRTEFVSNAGTDVGDVSGSATVDSSDNTFTLQSKSTFSSTISAGDTIAIDTNTDPSDGVVVNLTAVEFAGTSDTTVNVAGPGGVSISDGNNIIRVPDVDLNVGSQVGDSAVSGGGSISTGVVDTSRISAGDLVAFDDDGTIDSGTVYAVADAGGSAGSITLDILGQSGATISDDTDSLYLVDSIGVSGSEPTIDLDNYNLDSGSQIANAMDHAMSGGTVTFDATGYTSTQYKIDSGSTGSGSAVAVDDSGSGTNVADALNLDSTTDNNALSTSGPDTVVVDGDNSLTDDTTTPDHELGSGDNLKYNDNDGDGGNANQYDDGEDIIEVNDVTDGIDEGTSAHPVDGNYGDALADFTVVQTGTLANSSVDALTLYREGNGNDGFQAESADTKLQRQTFSSNGEQWNFTAIDETFGTTGRSEEARLYVTANISSGATAGDTVEMVVPGTTDDEFTPTDGSSVGNEGLFLESGTDTSGIGANTQTITATTSITASTKFAKNEPRRVRPGPGPEDDVFPGESFNTTTLEVSDSDGDSDPFTIGHVRVNSTDLKGNYGDSANITNVTLLNTTSGDLIAYDDTANTTSDSPSGDAPHFNVTEFNVEVPDDSAYNFTVNVTLAETGLTQGDKIGTAVTAGTNETVTSEGTDADKQEIKTVKIHGWRVASGTKGDMNDISVFTSASGAARTIQLQNASGGINLKTENFDNDTVFDINATFYDYEPRGAISQGKNLNWTRRYPESNRVNVTFTVEPEDLNYILSTTPSLSNWPSGGNDQADISYNTSVIITVNDLSFMSSSDYSTLNGTLFSTDAQRFNPPSLSSSAYQTRIGAPGTTPKGDPNPGFFQAFLPDALLNQWGVTASQLQAQYKGSARDYTVIDMEGGVRVEFETTYSAGDVDISPASGGDSGPPTAKAGSDRTAAEDTTVQFDGSLSKDDSGVDSYEWDFGDGGTATGKVVEHTFTDPGTYEVTLTVTDTAGKTDTDTATVTVTDETAPTADAGADRTVSLTESVSLDASGSTDNDGIESYEWNLGDGTTTTGESVTHTYDATGTYEVTLTVTDAAGNQATNTATVTVVTDKISVTDATLATGTVSVGETVDVTATLTNDGGADGSYTAELSAGGEAVTSKAVTVPAGDSVDVTLSDTFDSAGSYTLSVGDTEAGTLTVEEQTTTATETTTVTATTTATETVTKTITGTATTTATETATETITGTTTTTATETATETITGTTTTTATETTTGPTATEIETTTTGAEEGNLTTTTTTTSPGTPGFTLFVAVVALAFVAVRRWT